MAGNKTICLTMIVKNEALVIRRCLDSARPLVDCWLIVDTGSTDGTQDIIREHFKDLPGRLVERPWVDFAHNRSEALELARPLADYSLIVDADDIFEVPADYTQPELGLDSYMVDIALASIRYQRTQLVSSRLQWRYRGVLHEFLTCEEASGVGHFPVTIRCSHDGARRKDPQTYVRDAAVLERALESETDPFLRSRYFFYLAQSYRDCRQKEKALETYLKRAELGFWEQEVFCALYEAAKIKEELGHDVDETIAVYLRASEAAANRAEAYHGAARLCRYKGRNQQGYEIAKRGLALEAPGQGLFVETWIYQYGLKDEFAVNAYWAGKYREAMRACLDILESPACPADMRSRVIANARFSTDRLAETPEPASLLLRVREPGYKVNWPSPSASPSRGNRPLISVITPTRERESFLASAWRYFAAQDYSNCEWLILDDGPAPDPAFAAAPSNIRYTHVENRLSIGAKRNWLVEQARGEIIVHFDDDDYYAPGYINRMVAELESRNADLLNLRGWWLHDLRTDCFGYWDLERKTGPHFRCDKSGVSIVIPGAEVFEDNHYGFGFSYVYRKSVWERHKFPDVDFNEDGRFSRAVREDCRVEGFADTSGMVLHRLHESSTSRCFPQFLSPEFLRTKLFADAQGEQLLSKAGGLHSRERLAPSPSREPTFEQN